MHLTIVYNPHDARQAAMRDAIKAQLGGHADSVDVEAYGPEVAARYRIRALPALILAPEHLQGEHLLEATESGGVIGVVAEALAAFETEERAIHNPQAERVGPYVAEQITTAEDSLMLDLIERGLLNV